MKKGLLSVWTLVTGTMLKSILVIWQTHSTNPCDVAETAIIWYDLWKIGKVRDAMEAAGFKMLRLIIWQKTNPVPFEYEVYLSL